MRLKRHQEAVQALGAGARGRMRIRTMLRSAATGTGAHEAARAAALRRQGGGWAPAGRGAGGETVKQGGPVKNLTRETNA